MQNEIIAFLSDPSTFGAPVKRIDTHAAIVFLSGDRAFKIKRAVCLPFLDFSTLAQRKAGCEAELAVNKPFAPAIYLRTVPITRERDGSLAICGAGEAVEWALEMRRFDEAATLDKLAARGTITTAIAADTADAIAASHARAPATRALDWVPSIPAIIRQNAEAFRTDTTFPGLASRRLEQLATAAYEAQLPLIESRAATGFVRRCHGDLHLANIALIDGKPTLFDAIEFDARLATIDVLHDAAFTLMDLIQHRCVRAANVLLNRYLELTPRDGLSGLGLLPLFMSLRAAVRANVLSLQAGREADPAKKDRAASYFSLAQSVLAPPQPALIAIGGLSGTGKSAVARELAPFSGAAPGAIVLRSDTTRKRMFGRSELDRLPPAAYQPEITASVYTRLADEAETIVRQGHVVIVDAVFAREGEREAIEARARAADVPFAGIFLTADLATRQARVSRRTGDASDATADVVQVQERYSLGEMGWSTVDGSGTLAQSAERCASVLARIGLAPDDTSASSPSSPGVER